MGVGQSRVQQLLGMVRMGTVPGTISRNLEGRMGMVVLHYNACIRFFGPWRESPGARLKGERHGLGSRLHACKTRVFFFQGSRVVGRV